MLPQGWGIKYSDCCLFRLIAGSVPVKYAAEKRLFQSKQPFLGIKEFAAIANLMRKQLNLASNKCPRQLQ
jgi:hypothetical protein